MKFKFHLGIGLVGCQREAIVEVPDEDFEGCETEEEMMDVLYDSWLPEWADNYIEYWAEKVE